MTDTLQHSVNVEPLLTTAAAALAGALRSKAQAAGHEDEIRIEAAKHIERFIDDAGLKIKARHEYGLAGGRIDSKYGGVILEYKNPTGADALGEKGKSKGTAKAIKQVKDRFAEFEKVEGIAPDRLFAATLDGRHIIYITHDGRSFDVGDRFEISEETIIPLLRALVSIGARGTAFTPDNLVRDFGFENATATESVRLIYNGLLAASSEKAKTFFGQWELMFSEVCGYNLHSPNRHIAELAEHYGIASPKPARLLFAIHSYYAIFIKLLAAEICSALSPIPMSAIRRAHAAVTSDALLNEMTELEDGGIWSKIGIKNFLEGDIFSWYLSEWKGDVHKAVRQVLETFVTYDVTTLSVDPSESRDLLKKLYQNLLSKDVRHDLGEYYTADWLAEHTLDRAKYLGDPQTRVLDPACGSGTFLVSVINRIKRWYKENRFTCGFDEAHLLELILANVVGFELNPLAVMASRVNYLLAIRDLLRHGTEIDVPIYLCDSVLGPTAHGSLFTGRLGAAYRLRTNAGDMIIPGEVTADPHLLARFTTELERAIVQSYSEDQFVSRCVAAGIPVNSKEIHVELFRKLSSLAKSGRNGIWTRIIKNAFAPLFLQRVDLVVGNPPWINWESLPNDYRDDLKSLWLRYDLFTLTGAKARLGGGKKDLSMLFVYVCVDRYLKDGAMIAFVITQTVFKTRGAGDGFRRFRFDSGNQRVRIRPSLVLDLSGLQVFDGATNRTAVLIAHRSPKDVSYPVPYLVWNGPARIAENRTLTDVLASVSIKKLSAIPVEKGKSTSPWLTIHESAVPGVTKLLGKTTAFRAFEGVNTGGLSGCYWIKVLEKVPTGILIENLYDEGKKKLKKVREVIESDLVYPLIRGRDIRMWSVDPSAHQIISQDPDTRAPIALSTMSTKYPMTLAYLSRFKKELLARKSSSVRKLMEDGKFYAMFGVSHHTFAKYKVLWPELNNTIEAAVSLPSKKLPLPDHTVVFIPCESQDAAYFVCGIVNSTPFRTAVRGYIALHPSPHVLDVVAVPRFSKSDPKAVKLVDLARRCHEPTPDDKLSVLQRQIDQAVAAIYGLSKAELDGIYLDD